MEEDEFEDDEELAGEQAKNSKEARIERLKPWQFQPGQSGNPSGRPKGPSLKEWAKIYLAGMTDEERFEFMKGLNKNDIWKMAEGAPAQDVTSGGEALKPITVQISESIAKKNGITSSPESNSQ